MRALKRILAMPSRAEPAALQIEAGLLAQFSAATIELNPSLGSAEFANRLATRAAEMLGAASAVVALGDHLGWRIAAASGAGALKAASDNVTRELAIRLAELASLPSSEAEPSPALRAGAAEKLLGSRLAGALGWQEILYAALTGSAGELEGVLCLADFEEPLSALERQLLEALAGHASVSLENVRLFSKIEQSRKQWVQDFDAISDWIVVHDANARLLRLNRALAAAIGVRPVEAAGLDMRELHLLGTPGQTPNPSGMCPFCRDPEAAGEELTHTFGERTYLISSSRLEGAHGEGRRTIHVFKDITDRREAERRYRRERDFNRNVLNHTQSMILVLDTAGLVSYANRRCREAGYAESELLGRPLEELVFEAQRPAFAQTLEAALRGGTVSCEVPLRRGDGARRQFSANFSPMRDEQGEINSIVVVMTDVTEAADLQAKLMQTEKMAALGQLVSGVAHEINNPLAAIVGFSDLLLENQEVPAAAKEELKVILQEAERTRRIVQNLLSFARQMPARREPVDVNAVLRQTLRLRAYDFANHGVDLAEDFDASLPEITGDAHQLQQAFLNIVNNAYDAVQGCGRRGRIEVSTGRRGTKIEIRFRDNGSGITQPERIFDPFFTTKEVGKGTGLGLSICYGIIRAHRGEIQARNHAEAPGCTFTISLPAQTNMDASAGRRAAMDEAGA